MAGSRRYGAAVVVVAAVVAALALAPSARAAGQLTCRYTASVWPGGFSADVMMVNDGPAVVGWTAELVYSHPARLGQAWLAWMTQPAPYTMDAQHMFFNPVIPEGGAVTFGWTATTAVHEPPAISVNGVPC